MLNVLIPCAGVGKRFSEAGYSLPKPLIEVDGQPMLKRVIDNLRLNEPHKLFVIVKAKTAIYEYCKQWFPESVIVLDHDTDGAARTCLRAKVRINNQVPLLIANCDQLALGIKNGLGIIDLLTREKEDASVLTFKADNSKRWSYADTYYGQILQIAEKQAISNRATCGYYWFRRGKDFVTAAEKMIAANDRTNNEFYVAPSLNYMIAEGFKVKEVRCEDYGARFVGLGTPEDLEKYLKEKK